MAEVTNEPMPEVLKSIHAEVCGMKDRRDEMNAEMQVFRAHGTAIRVERSAANADTANIHAIVTRVEENPRRIEHRLDSVEDATFG